MSLTGRQCFVETHSEYLVNRIRLRIAQSSTDAIQNSVRLLFARIENGQSRFSEVEVNQYGAIVNWPKGFFDEGQDDLEQILEAAARKRHSGI